MTQRDEMDRLEAAIEVWLAHRASGEGALGESDFLAAHEELRDLLEPMLADANRDADVHDVDSGRCLGDYRLIREIGRGGMGIVYEAWQASLDRRVAIKLLRPDLAAVPKSIARFKQEAFTAARLDHPGIVDVLSVTSEDDQHFIAMEFVDGVPLDRVIAETQRSGLATMSSSSLMQAVTRLQEAHDADPIDQVATAVPERSYVHAVITLIASVADALHYAHEQGVIHRDVKPSNIVLRTNGSALLLDFGLAREEGLPALTCTGEFAGTPYYVSPEQAISIGKALDRRTDVFSLGATLFELLTHRRPFEGETQHAVIQRILTREPPDLKRINAVLSPDQVAVVMKALEKDRDRRYATAAEFAQDLRASIELRPVTARRLTRARRIVRWSRREPALALLVGVLALGVPALTGLGGYVVASQTELRAGAEVIHERKLESILAEAYAKLFEQRLSVAEARFRTALDLAPDSARVLAGYGLTLVQQRRDEEAFRLFDAAQVSSPALDRVRWIAAREAGSAEAGTAYHEPEEALDLFLAGLDESFRRVGGKYDPHAAKALGYLSQAAIRSHRLWPVIHYARIRVAHDNLQGHAAADAAQAVEALWPDQPETYRWLALGYSRSDAPRAITYFRMAIDATPEDPDLWLALGDILSQTGAHDDAEHAVSRAIELGVSQTEAPWSTQALVRLRAGNIEASGESYAHAVEARECGPVLLRIAGIHAAERRHELAIEVLQQAVQLEPDSYAAHSRLANLYQFLERLPDALPHARRAMELNPGDADALSSFARAVPKTDWPYDPVKDAEAITALERSVAIDANQARAWANLARYRCRQRQFESTIRAARRALALDPSLQTARNALAYALVELERPHEARAHLLQLLDIDAEVYAERFRIRAVRIKLRAREAKQADIELRALVLREVLSERFPESEVHHSGLLAALSRTSQWDRLVSEARRWSSVRPEDGEAWSTLASVLMDSKLPRHMRAPYIAAYAANKNMELSGRSVSTLGLLAEAEYRNRRTSLAIQIAEDALALAEKENPKFVAYLRKRLAVYRAKLARQK